MKHNETYTWMYMNMKFQWIKNLPCHECCFAGKDEDGDPYCNIPNNFKFCEDGGYIKIQK